MAVHVSDMLEQLAKEQDSVTGYPNISIKDTLGMQQRLVQELLVLQQEQDLALAIKLGEA